MENKEAWIGICSSASYSDRNSWVVDTSPYNPKKKHAGKVVSLPGFGTNDKTFHVYTFIRDHNRLAVAKDGSLVSGSFIFSDLPADTPVFPIVDCSSPVTASITGGYPAVVKKLCSELNVDTSVFE